MEEALQRRVVDADITALFFRFIAREARKGIRSLVGDALHGKQQDACNKQLSLFSEINFELAGWS
jgi:hypothetical protein